MAILLLTGPLRRAMVDALKGSPGVAAIVGDRVFDYVPNKPQIPYVRIEQASAVPYENNCSVGSDARVNVAAFIARDPLNLDNTVDFGNAIIAALDDQDLALDTGYVLSLSVDSFQTIQDQGDQSLYHLILRFAAITVQSR